MLSNAGAASPASKVPGVWSAKPPRAGTAGRQGPAPEHLGQDSRAGRLCQRGLRHAEAPRLTWPQKPGAGLGFSSPQAADKPGSPCPARTCRPGEGGWLPGRELPTGEDFSSTKWKSSSTGFMEKRILKAKKKRKRKHQKDTRTKPLGCRELTTTAAGEVGGFGYARGSGCVSEPFLQ